MKEEDGRRLAAAPKLGEPMEEWTQARPNTFSNVFGVMDADGKTIKGMHVELEVYVPPRLGFPKFVFSLFQYEAGRTERAYQLEVNCRPGLRPGDHNATHDHYGEARFAADASWSSLSFAESVVRFCENTNLTFTVRLPDYQEFQLK